jgi:hypothetical protein
MSKRGDILNYSLVNIHYSFQGSLPQIITFDIVDTARCADNSLQIPELKCKIIHEFALADIVYPDRTVILHSLYIERITAFLPDHPIRISGSNNAARAPEGRLIRPVKDVYGIRILGVDQQKRQRNPQKHNISSHLKLPICTLTLPEYDYTRDWDLPESKRR